MFYWFMFELYMFVLVCVCLHRRVASSCHEERQAGVGALGSLPRQVSREHKHATLTLTELCSYNKTCVSRSYPNVLVADVFHLSPFFKKCIELLLNSLEILF